MFEKRSKILRNMVWRQLVTSAAIHGSVKVEYGYTWLSG